MGVILDDAVVVRRLDYSETSQVVVLMTRGHGKVRAIAKGVKRSTKTRFATAIDLLELGRVGLSLGSASQDRLATLTEWRQTRSFWGLRQSLSRMYAGQYAAETISLLTEDRDPHVELFTNLVDLLDALCEATSTTGLLVGFLGRLLSDVGLAPRLDACVGCGRSVEALRGQLHFSSNEGGVLCRDCEAARVEKCRLSRVALAVLISDGRVAGGGVESDQVEALRVLNYHTAHLIGRPPYMAEWVFPRAKRPTPRARPAR